MPRIFGIAQCNPPERVREVDRRAGGPFIAQSIEVRPDGSKAYVLQVNRSEYRSLRIRTLYQD